MKNLLTRTITGIVYAALILAGMCLNEVFFVIVFVIAAALTLWEFYGLMENYADTSLNRKLHTVGGVSLFICAYLHASGLAGTYAFSFYILYVLAIFIDGLYNRNTTDPVRDWGCILMGQVWCAAPFAMMNYLVFNSDGSFMTDYLPAIIIFVWLSDSGAYLAGTAFGRHRLFERISPKKSWEGFFGGLIVACIASQIFAMYNDTLTPLMWGTLAIITVAFGTWGDLCESLLKRRLGVKDSGKLLPGHGGMMDRFDSILMAVPAALLFLMAFA
jgi:phosphatidate cytidylyltransferase